MKTKQGKAGGSVKKGGGSKKGGGDSKKTRYNNLIKYNQGTSKKAITKGQNLALEKKSKLRDTVLDIKDEELAKLAIMEGQIKVKRTTSRKARKRSEPSITGGSPKLESQKDDDVEMKLAEPGSSLETNGANSEANVSVAEEAVESATNQKQDEKTRSTCILL